MDLVNLFVLIQVDILKLLIFFFVNNIQYADIWEPQINSINFESLFKVPVHSRQSLNTTCLPSYTSKIPLIIMRRASTRILGTMRPLRLLRNILRLVLSSPCKWKKMRTSIGTVQCSN